MTKGNPNVELAGAHNECRFWFVITGLATNVPGCIDICWLVLVTEAMPGEAIVEGMLEAMLVTVLHGSGWSEGTLTMLCASPTTNDREEEDEEVEDGVHGADDGDVELEGDDALESPLGRARLLGAAPSALVPEEDDGS